MYGITNCDTVRSARRTLAEQGIDVEFSDFATTPPTLAQVEGWMARAGWERVLNRRGTTWRRLDESVRESVVDAPTAAAVAVANPSAIKRPVVEWADGKLTIGFTKGEFVPAEPG